MCIRDRVGPGPAVTGGTRRPEDRLQVAQAARRFLEVGFQACLLYTSDAADDLLCVDLGGRRIIKKKKYTLL